MLHLVPSFCSGTLPASVKNLKVMVHLSGMTRRNLSNDKDFYGKKLKKRCDNEAANKEADRGFIASVMGLLGLSKSGEQQRREAREQRENAANPYIQYPLVTREQMNRVSNDKYRFDVGFASFAHHSACADAIIQSLSDLTDRAQLNSLLPRRRLHGFPVDTLSIKAGDDAMLVSPTVVAIADGVSGWESHGEQCSSGVWARSMLETMSRLMTEHKLGRMPHPLSTRDVQQVLDDSFLHTSHLMDLQGLKGSSTFILGMVSGDTLKYICIGDSRLFVIRDGEIIRTSDEHNLHHLCPQQIGTQTLGRMPSEMAVIDEVSLQEHDIVILCSDGVSDNLFDWEIVQELDEHLKFNKDSLRSTCKKIISKCKSVAYNDNAYTPYNMKVSQLPSERFGYTDSLGGKMDDMSLCIARVVCNKK